ncbi:hypothetical protein RB608_09160 [Nocardioides sp. LHD-245]|uniref:hypothetical protein n=1 Tax=Nocardioides sp. LHD-245 TaxID=3051387 RepID=UPI0027DFD3C9|nr:hypothetical protein [Nocardioides sp. LHD-245]
MEGRALDRQPYQGWAFMVPFLGAVAAAQLGDAAGAGRAPYLVLAEHHVRRQDRRAEDVSPEEAPGPSRGSAPR